MTPDVPDITPDLPPGDDAAMRDLLASMGSAADPAPMPAEVRRRLDAVIAEQSTARRGTSAGRPVRRLAVAWLGAAAAVLVAVAGIGVVAQQVRGNDSAESSTAAVQDSGEAGAGSVLPSPSPTTTSDGDTTDSATELSAALPVVRPDHLAEDALAILAVDAGARVSVNAPRQGCVVNRPQRHGRQVFGVTYQGKPAVLIITDGPPRTASVWSCSDVLLQSVELPD